MSLCSVTEKVNIQAPLDKVFQHFTDTDQVVRSFPGSFHSRLIRRSSRHMTQGSSMEYEMRLWGILIKWKTHVHSFSPRRHISCIWQKSVYASIEQDLYFESINSNQTRVTECLLYKVPFGRFGRIINSLFFEPFLRKLIAHKKKNLQSTFELVP